MTLPTAEIQTLTPGAEFVGYVLDATAIGGALYRFHAGVNINGADVVWQGNTYTRYPIQASGFEMTSKGVMPRPTLQVANIDGTIAAQIRAYGDLVGATVTRKRTLAKFLDAVNFPTLTAISEPFVPSGTTGQLSIGGVSITVNAAVTEMIRTDWQGAQALYAIARTNVCPISEPTLAQVAWKTAGVSNSSAPSPFTGNAVNFPVAAQEDYEYMDCPACIGVVDPIVSVFVKMTDSGTPVLGVTGSTGDFRLVLNDGAATANTNFIYQNLGAGLWRVSGKWIGTLSASHIGVYRAPMQSGRGFATVGIQVEASVGRTSPTSYIPTTTVPVTVTDYTATSAGVVTLGETASGTYTWSGSGKGNATADPTAQFPDDVFYVERKSEENQLSISFELSAACDLQGLLLPRQIVQASCCMWNNAAVCAYSVGGACAKTLDACKAHWGGADLPFSGFPGTVNA